MINRKFNNCDRNAKSTNVTGQVQRKNEVLIFNCVPRTSTFPSGDHPYNNGQLKCGKSSLYYITCFVVQCTTFPTQIRNIDKHEGCEVAANEITLSGRVTIRRTFFRFSYKQNKFVHAKRQLLHNIYRSAFLYGLSISLPLMRCLQS